MGISNRVSKWLLLTIMLSAPAGYSQVMARDVINKMADVYSYCASYRDQGKVTQQTGRTISFTTAFQRPALFKFEYSSSVRLGLLPHKDHFVLWRTGSGDVQMWWSVKPRVEIKPMNRAIASVTGVSATSGHIVPRLLMPEEVTGFSLASSWMDPAVSLIEEMVDGHACYKISGHYPFGRDETLSIWVDKESFLIRKLVDKRQVISYSPEINVSIDPSAFQFQVNEKVLGSVDRTAYITRE